MLALDQRSRGAILASSAGCFLAAVAISPISARTEAVKSASPSIVSQAYVAPAPLPANVKPNRDPFVAASDDDSDAGNDLNTKSFGGTPQFGTPIPPVPAMTGRGALPPNAGAGNSIAMVATGAPAAREPSVRAVIVGDHPYAVVDDGASTRLVGIGGAFGTQRIIGISLAGVTLGDGERIGLSSASATPAPYPANNTKPQIVVVPYPATSASPNASPAPAPTPISPSQYENYQSIQSPSQSGAPLQPLQNQFGYGQPAYGQPGYRPPAAASPDPSATTATNFEQAF